MKDTSTARLDAAGVDLLGAVVGAYTRHPEMIAEYALLDNALVRVKALPERWVSAWSSVLMRLQNLLSTHSAGDNDCKLCKEVVAKTLRDLGIGGVSASQSQAATKTEAEAGAGDAGASAARVATPGVVQTAAAEQQQASFISFSEMNTFLGAGSDTVMAQLPKVGECPTLYVPETAFTLPLLKQLCLYIQYELFKMALANTTFD
eukprot:6886667-Alexandrium_andersonii.AAC.1